MGDGASTNTPLCCLFLLCCCFRLFFRRLPAALLAHSLSPDPRYPSTPCITNVHDAPLPHPDSRRLYKHTHFSTTSRASWTTATPRRCIFIRKTHTGTGLGRPPPSRGTCMQNISRQLVLLAHVSMYPQQHKYLPPHCHDSPVHFFFLLLLSPPFCFCCC